MEFLLIVVLEFELFYLSHCILTFLWFVPTILVFLPFNINFIKFSDSYLYAKHECTMADFSTRAWTSSVSDGILLQFLPGKKENLYLHFMSHSTLGVIFQNLLHFLTSNIFLKWFILWHDILLPRVQLRANLWKSNSEKINKHWQKTVSLWGESSINIFAFHS